LLGYHRSYHQASTIDSTTAATGDKPALATASHPRLFTDSPVKIRNEVLQQAKKRQMVGQTIVLKKRHELDQIYDASDALTRLLHQEVVIFFPPMIYINTTTDKIP
jgi:hypothetical protein